MSASLSSKRIRVIVEFRSLQSSPYNEFPHQIQTLQIDQLSKDLRYEFFISLLKKNASKRVKGEIKKLESQIVTEELDLTDLKKISNRIRQDESRTI